MSDNLKSNNSKIWYLGRKRKDYVFKIKSIKKTSQSLTRFK